MRRYALFIACAALAAAASLLTLSTVPVLVVKNERGRVLARIACEDGRFVHRYVHSVHLSDVDEEYAMEADGTLRLTATRFDTLGVGIPYDAEDGFRLEGDRFVLRMDRKYRSLPVRVSPIPGHMILTGGREYPLSAWLHTGDLAVLEAKHPPRIRLRPFLRRTR